MFAGTKLAKCKGSTKPSIVEPLLFVEGWDDPVGLCRDDAHGQMN